MTTERLMNIKSMVLFELSERPVTRSNDRLLIYYVYRDYYGIQNETFYDVMMREDLPNYESIRRCRAKIQAERDDLKAEDNVISFRADNEQAYFNFFTEV